MQHATPISPNLRAFEVAPVYELNDLRLRQTTPADAQDLLSCYNDPAAQPLFNSDNCTGDFRIATLENMLACIAAWDSEYAQRVYVRWSVIDLQTGHAVGTVELCPRQDALGRVGVLRIDLASAYETRAVCGALLQLADAHLFTDFELKAIVTKAIPAAAERVAALAAHGYTPLTPQQAAIPFPHYYVKARE